MTFAVAPLSTDGRGRYLMLHLFLDDSGKESQQTNPWEGLSLCIRERRMLW
jgi:hypothetical protein